jgi:pimeloyl-ACP methyl ester carboxylesterase
LYFSQFGTDHGRLVVYFHGAPGAPEEARVFDEAAKQQDLTIICFDRFSLDISIKGEAYYQHLARSIEGVASGRPVDFIGFSIGAFVAIQTCRYMAGGVKHLHLVSAAAPLDAGNYVDAMAGKAVFYLAKHFPALFLVLSYWQGLLAFLFPSALFRLIFANTAGADKLLAKEQGFRTSMSKVLRTCFVGRVLGYIRDVDAYVQPWQATLSEITVNTSIWHGSEDNWSPAAMADYLQSAIPGCTSKKIFNGLSHYSCLYQAAGELCNRSSSA